MANNYSKSLPPLAVACLIDHSVILYVGLLRASLCCDRLLLSDSVLKLSPRSRTGEVAVMSCFYDVMIP